MTQSALSVSIVVATRNRASLLVDCLKSLVTQDFPEERYEIILVDDGSTDDTAQVVDVVASARGVPEVRYIRQEARGLTAARNAGIAAAQGEMIAFTDDDVVAPESWIGAVIEGSLRHPKVECFGGPARLRVEGEVPRLCERCASLDGRLDLGGSERMVEFVAGCNLAIRKDAFLRVGLFNETVLTYGDDAEWESRLLRGGGSIVYLPTAYVWHRRTGADLTTWRLVRSRFLRWAQRPAFALAVGETLTLGAELKAIPRPLLHAVRRGCVGGLIKASGHAGCAWGLVRANWLGRTEVAP